MRRDALDSSDVHEMGTVNAYESRWVEAFFDIPKGDVDQVAAPADPDTHVIAAGL